MFGVLKKLPWCLVILLCLALPGLSTSKDYGDIVLSGGFAAGNFSEVWDLTKGDMYILVRIDLTGLVDDDTGMVDENGKPIIAHAWSEIGIRDTSTTSNFNPTWKTGGKGVWVATDYDWTADTFDPDPSLDLDDKLILQRGGGLDESYYDLPSSPPDPGANHRIWFDRDGVDQWQAQSPLAVDGGTYNTGGVYYVVIRLHATSATTGEAYMTINGLDQGFEVDGNWNTMELTPAGITFTGDMTRMQVFYGLFGYGATHVVQFGNIAVILTDVVWVDDDWARSSVGDKVDGHYFGYDAFATVQDGVDHVGRSTEGVGGTVNVASGTYTGASINKGVTVQGDPAGDSVLTDGVVYKTGRAYKTAFLLKAGADGTTIKDFTIVNDASKNFYFAVFSWRTNDVTVQGLTIYDTVQGISNWGGSNWSILDNKFIGTVASGGGGIGILIGATSGGYETASNNLIQGNVIGTDATAPDYSCPGIAVVLDLRGGSYDPTARYDIGWNRIVGNYIEDGGVVNGVGIEVGVIAETGNDPAKVPEILAATLGSIHDTTIAENTVIGEDIGIYLYNVVGTDVFRNIISGCTSYGIGMWDGNINNVFRYNSITGNKMGLYNGTGALVDAALNWWGDPDGPTHASNPNGTGDAVSDNVIYSPWLGTDPDGDRTKPGVQITGPVLIVVAPVGPEPAGGYLNQAIAGANELPYADTIEVRHGTYDASTPITGPVTLVSQAGSASSTHLTGSISLRSGGVIIGMPLRGFTIHGNVTVESLVDAASSAINWCNIYGTVTNNGIGTFDARYNYWGTVSYAEIDSRTIGDINVDPYLPENADDAYRHVLGLIGAGVVGNVDEAIDQLWGMYRLGLDLEGYLAYLSAAGVGAFRLGAPGAAVAGGAGGLFLEGQVAGGAGALGLAADGAYVQGDPIVGRFFLSDPVTGEPMAYAAVTITLTDPSGQVVYWGAAAYDPSTGEYTFAIDTDGFTPGTYVLTIQEATGAPQTFTIEILAP